MNTNDNRLKAHKLIDHIFQDLLPAHGMAQRPEQIQLSHRMLDAMQDGRIALCDAGTGIGKTYAYLAAATAASAFPTGQIARPIIISTSSIALQNAVLMEYLPLLSCILMADGILTKPLKAVIRKGKSHYVCDERLDRRLRQVNLGKKNPEALAALRTLILRGTEEPEKFLLVSAHLDAWCPGVTCNATGDGTMLEMMRVFGQFRDKIKRSIYFIYWNGHEIAEAAGSTWFQDYFYEDIRNNCIGYINIDSTGMRGAEKYGTDASRELSDYAYEMIRDVLDEDVDVAYLAKTGDQSFFGVGVPSIAGRISYSPEVVKQQNGATLGYWNHTCEDSIDKMDVDNLEKDNRVDLGVIYGLANATVLPYDFSKTCEDMKQKVEYLRKESGNIVDMECISANIDRLGKAVAALNEMKLKASELSEVRIRAFNDTLLRLSRAITNAFYTNAEKYDQDSYGRTILSKPLPLLFPTIKLSRLDKDTLEYRLLYTQMLRNRNRVADAVLTACEYAELFLAQK